MFGIGLHLSDRGSSFDTISQPHVTLRRRPAAIKTLQRHTRLLFSSWDCVGAWTRLWHPGSAIPDFRIIVANANYIVAGGHTLAAAGGLQKLNPSRANLLRPIDIYSQLERGNSGLGCTVCVAQTTY